jgi:type II secretory pathway pseudopilin PulG
MTGCKKFILKISNSMHPDVRALGTPHPKRHQMTLIEVMISFVIFGILAQAMVSGLMSIRRAIQLNTFHTTAAAICVERIEQLRATPYDQLESGNVFPAKTGLTVTDTGNEIIIVENDIPLTHTERTETFLVNGTCTVELRDISYNDSMTNQPVNAIEATVTLDWMCLGRDQTQQVQTIVYDYASDTERSGS